MANTIEKLLNFSAALESLGTVNGYPATRYTALPDTVKPDKVTSEILQKNSLSDALFNSIMNMLCDIVDELGDYCTDGDTTIGVMKPGEPVGMSLRRMAVAELSTTEDLGFVSQITFQARMIALSLSMPISYGKTYQDNEFFSHEDIIYKVQTSGGTLVMGNPDTPFDHLDVLSPFFPYGNECFFVTQTLLNGETAFVPGEVVFINVENARVQRAVATKSYSGDLYLIARVFSTISGTPVLLLQRSGIFDYDRYYPVPPVGAPESDYRVSMRKLAVGHTYYLASDTPGQVRFTSPDICIPVFTAIGRSSSGSGSVTSLVSISSARLRSVGDIRNTTITSTGSLGPYNLYFYPNSKANLLVHIIASGSTTGVILDPDRYTISGSTITFNGITFSSGSKAEVCTINSSWIRTGAAISEKVNTVDGANNLLGPYPISLDPLITISAVSTSGSTITVPGTDSVFENTRIIVYTHGTQPSPLVNGTLYYARNVTKNTTTVFQLSSTPTGSIITITSTGSGSIRIKPLRYEPSIPNAADIMVFIQNQTTGNITLREGQGVSQYTINSNGDLLFVSGHGPVQGNHVIVRRVSEMVTLAIKDPIPSSYIRDSTIDSRILASEVKERGFENILSDPNFNYIGRTNGISDGANIFDSISLDWKDPASWSVSRSGGFSGSLRWDAEEQCLVATGGEYASLNRIINADTSQSWYTGADIRKTSSARTVFLGTISRNAANEYPLYMQHPGSWEYFGLYNVNVPETWTTYNNHGIGGRPRTGISTNRLDLSTFDPNTVYLQPMFVANYVWPYAENSDITRIRNLSLICQGLPSPKSYEWYPVNNPILARSFTSNYIFLSISSRVNTYSGVDQNIPNPERFAGKEVTLVVSILKPSGAAGYVAIECYSGAVRTLYEGGQIPPNSSSWQTKTVTVTIPSDVTQMKVLLRGTGGTVPVAVPTSFQNPRLYVGRVYGPPSRTIIETTGNSHQEVATSSNVTFDSPSIAGTLTVGRSITYERKKVMGYDNANETYTRFKVDRNNAFSGIGELVTISEASSTALGLKYGTIYTINTCENVESSTYISLASLSGTPVKISTPTSGVPYVNRIVMVGAGLYAKAGCFSNNDVQVAGRTATSGLVVYASGILAGQIGSTSSRPSVYASSADSVSITSATATISGQLNLSSYSLAVGGAVTAGAATVSSVSGDTVKGSTSINVSTTMMTGNPNNVQTGYAYARVATNAEERAWVRLENSTGAYTDIGFSRPVSGQAPTSDMSNYPVVYNSDSSRAELLTSGCGLGGTPVVSFFGGFFNGSMLYYRRQSYSSGPWYGVKTINGTNQGNINISDTMTGFADNRVYTRNRQEADTGDFRELISDTYADNIRSIPPSSSTTPYAGCFVTVNSSATLARRSGNMLSSKIMFPPTTVYSENGSGYCHSCIVPLAGNLVMYIIGAIDTGPMAITVNISESAEAVRSVVFGPSESPVVTGCALDSSKVLVALVDTGSGCGRLNVVWTDGSGRTINMRYSASAAVAFSTASVDKMKLLAISDTRAIAVYRSSTNLYANLITIDSSNNVTVGSRYTLGDLCTDFSATLISSGLLAIVNVRNNSTVIASCIPINSNNTLDQSAGAVWTRTLTNITTSSSIDMVPVDSTHVLLASGAASSTVRVFALTLNQDKTMSEGEMSSYQMISSSESPRSISLVAASNERFFLGYQISSYVLVQTIGLTSTYSIVDFFVVKMFSSNAYLGSVPVSMAVLDYNSVVLAMQEQLSSDSDPVNRIGRMILKDKEPTLLVSGSSGRVGEFGKTRGIVVNNQTLVMGVHYFANSIGDITSTPNNLPFPIVNRFFTPKNFEVGIATNSTTLVLTGLRC